MAVRSAGQALLLACLPLLLACGTEPHNLQSISLSPSLVDAQGKPVQFTATGHWTTDPTSTTPLPVSWGVCQNNAPTTAVTVSTAGVVTCSAAAKGTYTVVAAHAYTDGRPACQVLDACGRGCNINTSAQLTCP